MDKQHLLTTLEKLHDELAGMERVDDQVRDKLATLTADINKVLSDADDAEDDSLSGRVEDVVQEFGAEHPRLAEVLNQVSSALANLGI